MQANRYIFITSVSDIILKKNLGLYWDDGLGIFENMSGPEIERKKKYFVMIFKNNDLNPLMSNVPTWSDKL